MIMSRLTSKAQTTIPQSVRSALHLRAGDEIVYAIEHGRVVMTRAPPEREEDRPFRAFSVWESVADIEAYGGLSVRSGSIVPR